MEPLVIYSLLDEYHHDSHLKFGINGYQIWHVLQIRHEARKIARFYDFEFLSNHSLCLSALLFSTMDKNEIKPTRNYPSSQEKSENLVYRITVVHSSLTRY